jgi:hypothetical protein
VNFGRGASKKKLSILARGRRIFSLSFSKKNYYFQLNLKVHKKLRLLVESKLLLEAIVDF